MKRCLAVLVAFVSIFVLTASAWPYTSWNLAASGSWMNPANWSHNTLPDANTDAEVDLGSPYIDSPEPIARSLWISGISGTPVVEVQTGGTLTIRDFLSVGYWSGSGHAEFHQLGGTVTAPDLRLSQGSNTSGTYEIHDGELNAVTLGVGGWGGPSVFTQTGGTVNVTGAISIPLYYSNDKGACYTISGGRLDAGYIYMEESQNYGVGQFIIEDAKAEINVSRSFTIKAGGIFQAVPDSRIRMKDRGGLDLETADVSDAPGLNNVSFVFDTTIDGWIEAAGADMGAVAAGFVDNFALKDVTLTRSALVHVRNKNDNQPGSGDPDALYIRDLVLSKRSVLHLDGNNVYCQCFLNLGTVDDSGGGSLTFLDECHQFELVADPDTLMNDGESTSELRITLVVDHAPVSGAAILVTTDKGMLTDGATTDTSITVTTDAGGHATVTLVADDTVGTAHVKATWISEDWDTDCTVDMVEPSIEISASEARFLSVTARPAGDPVIESFFGSLPQITLYGVTEIPVKVRLISPDPGGKVINLSSEALAKVATSGFGEVLFTNPVTTDADGIAEFTLRVSNIYEHNAHSGSFDQLSNIDITARLDSMPSIEGQAEFLLVDNLQRINAKYLVGVPANPLVYDASSLNPIWRVLFDTGIWAGAVNNLLSSRYPEYSIYTCGNYQMQVLFFLDSLRLNSNEKWLLNGFDYGPIVQLNGAHQAALIWPSNHGWKTWMYGRVLDPWVLQSPAMYSWPEWMAIIGVATTPIGALVLDTSIRGGSTNYTVDGCYPTTGNPYPDTPYWAFPHVDPAALGMIVDCPIHMALTDNAGNRTGNVPDPQEGEAQFFSEIPGLRQYPTLLSDGTRGWYFEIPNTEIHMEVSGYADGDVSVWIVNVESLVPEPYSGFPVLTGERANVTLDPLATRMPPVVFTDGRTVLPDSTIGLEYLGYGSGTSKVDIRLTVSNNTQVAIHGPLQFIIEATTPASVTLANPDGTTQEGKPYVNLTGLLTNNKLDPGQEITREIHFTSQGSVRFSFSGTLKGLTASGKTLTARRIDHEIGSLDSWQMKQRDMHQTGRADYVVPASRLNQTFFDSPIWQTPTPSDGNLGSTSMTFFDGGGPNGADIVVGTYRWPIGVQGMDRHTGAVFWYGNPAGGEEIARGTAAFSNDGDTLYVVNRYTESETFPNGHPLMAFPTQFGPDDFWHNGSTAIPDNLGFGNPIVDPDGRIFLHNMYDRPYAGEDDGNQITETWGAATFNGVVGSDVTLYKDGDLLRVISPGWDGLKGYHGTTGVEMWVKLLGMTMDAAATVDPANGNIYVPAWDMDVFVVGLDKNGAPLWGEEPVALVHRYIEGENDLQGAPATGCLSHDGATYYFQTSSEQGNGRLYAVSTSDGSLKWSFETHSKTTGENWEGGFSSPIVTKNGVIIVGNNEGDTYYAILDQGTEGVLLDTLPVASDAENHARASATLSTNGLLYLPLRTQWTVGNGGGAAPDNQVHNLFAAFDLSPPQTPDVPSFAGGFGSASGGGEGDLDGDGDADGKDLALLAALLK